MPTKASVTSRDPYVVTFGAAPIGDADLGGKAASLDRLARSGHPIPPGFCVVATAFRAHLAAVADQAGLTTAIAGLPDDHARQAICPPGGGDSHAGWGRGSDRGRSGSPP